MFVLATDDINFYPYKQPCGILRLNVVLFIHLFNDESDKWTWLEYRYSSNAVQRIWSSRGLATMLSANCKFCLEVPGFYKDRKNDNRKGQKEKKEVYKGRWLKCEVHRHSAESVCLVNLRLKKKKEKVRQRGTSEKTVLAWLGVYMALWRLAPN